MITFIMVMLTIIFVFIFLVGFFGDSNNSHNRKNYNFDDDYYKDKKENDIDVSDYVTIEIKRGETSSKNKRRKKSLKQTNVKKENYKNKVIFIDTETTGLSNEDEFIEITAALAEFDKQGNVEILEEYTGLREPNVKLNPNAEKVHGISIEDLAGEKLDRDRLNNIFKRAHFITAHNASFDKRFLVKEFKQLNKKFWLCSMNGVKWKNRGFESKGLQNLLYDHEINVENSHRTKDDVMAMIQLLNCKASPRTTYFNQLLRNSKIKQKSIDFN